MPVQFINSQVAATSDTNHETNQERPMTAQEIADAAIARLNARITDEIFLIIQNDRDLMHEYLRAIESQQGGLTTVNQTIGRIVKDRYVLTNAENRQENPRSTLIQSHQQFAGPVNS